MHVLVAGFAEFVGNRNLEIGAMMTLGATHLEVLSQQRVFSLGMIKRLCNVAQGLPTYVVVAGPAVCAQGSLMRVLMTVLATSEWNTGVTDAGFGPIGGWLFLVTLRAGGLAMCARQLELRLGVVEARNVLPLTKGVALRAICSHLIVVFVLVTGDAIAFQTEEGAAEIPDTNSLPGIRRHVFGRVAALALQLCMSAFQRVTRLSVIEFIHVYVPQNRNEIPAVVFRVALDTSVVAPITGH